MFRTMLSFLRKIKTLWIEYGYLSLVKLVPIFLVFLFSCEQKKTEASGQPDPDSWIQLFNGKDLDGWTPKIRGYALNENYGNTFRVEDGELKVSYDQYDAFNEAFGHIFYKDRFSYYLLSLEYHFMGDQAKGGPDWAFRNSGAMLHCQDPATMHKDQDFPISIEVQLLGGNGKDDRTTANLCTPGTNVVMNGKLITDHCISSTSRTYHGDQWVNVKILVLGDSLIRHIIDGETVLEYEDPQIGDGNVSDFDPQVKKDGQLLNGGFISLQSESHPVAFRKVELFNLEPYAKDRKTLDAILQKLKLR
jgi:hypothetical protein